MPSRTAATVILFVLMLALPVAAAQNEEVRHLKATLTELAEMPAVSGNEEQVSAWLAQRLQPLSPQIDNLGNVVVTLGSGAPHRLLVTAIDEPGYVVSAITDDGFLRVQRLPQRGVHPWFELMHAAQPVQILTREGGRVPGVVAALSTHLQPGREAPESLRPDHPDRIYIDVGARSRDGVRALGIDLLDPLTLEKRTYALAGDQLAAPFLGERAGAAVLVRLLERLDAKKIEGTLTAAFVVRRHLGEQGLNRLLTRIQPDEVILLQRLESTPGAPGDGVLVAAIGEGSTEFGAELLSIGVRHGVMGRGTVSEPAVSARYFGPLPLPERTAAVGVAGLFPHSPAEVMSVAELAQVEVLLAAYLGLDLGRKPPGEKPPAAKEPTAAAPSSVESILEALVESYGVSGYEEPVVEEIRKLLPLWAVQRATTDAAGNLAVRFGNKSEKPVLLFVAHSDEIGWAVQEIRDDGRLVLSGRGGFIDYHFLGHVVYVHTQRGRVPAVLELPEAYLTEAYQSDRERPTLAYTGAHTRAETEGLGIRVGHSVTVPKQFRRLAGTRANGRSFDDRVGSAALAAALWEIEPDALDREVVFLWAVEEEVGLVGAKAYAEAAHREGGGPEFVFAIDTFVSADSPLESPRFAQGLLGEGFVIRAVDNSNVAPRRWVERVLEIARRSQIPAQYGVTGGGNDGAAFVPYGAVDIPLGWPLRYSHSPGEVVDLKDVEALARIVAALASEF